MENNEHCDDNFPKTRQLFNITKNTQFRLQITEFGFIQGLVTGAEVADRRQPLPEHCYKNGNMVK